MRTLRATTELVYANQDRCIPAYKLCCTATARDRFAADLARVGDDPEKLSQLVSRQLAAKEAVHRVTCASGSERRSVHDVVSPQHALQCEQWRTSQLLTRIRKIDTVRHEERGECDVPSILEMRK